MQPHHQISPYRASADRGGDEKALQCRRAGQQCDIHQRSRRREIYRHRVNRHTRESVGLDKCVETAGQVGVYYWLLNKRSPRPGNSGHEGVLTSQH